MNVAIAITVYNNPARLAALLDNMRWAGIPDIPLYILEDPCKRGQDTSNDYKAICLEKIGDLDYIFQTAPEWGCMQGIIDFALRATTEDWIIYVPDDVLFTRGGLWNEYAGVLTYGRDFVGCIQAPYWNAHDLVAMKVMPHREAMYQGWMPDKIPRNPHWDGEDLPRKYININGAGFSISRRLYDAMGGWPKCTWRLDEWAGYQAWKQGMCCITMPGPPRIHYFGGATPDMPAGLGFHTVEAWQMATGGLTPEQTGIETTRLMEPIRDGTWPGLLEYFSKQKRRAAA